MSTTTLEKPVHITDADFDEAINAGDRPVLVDFWADWCGPCHAIAPALEELATEYGEKLTVAKLNVDENPAKPAAFGIRSIPTLILFRNGQPVQTLVGVQPKSALKAAIDAQLS
ncbi:MAG: thioredoxin [Alphaproteobacteria bacterium]|nr:thioredoxin [Alphaproteobacteria bacterium]